MIVGGEGGANGEGEGGGVVFGGGEGGVNGGGEGGGVVFEEVKEEVLCL